MTQLLDVHEAAARLRCSTRRVFELLADGTLVRGPKYGRHTVITAESVEAALVPREQPVSAPPAPRAPRNFRADLDELVAREAARWKSP